MSERIKLIERERRKLDWLREKVTEQERRLRALEELKDDPLDEMFERELAAADPVHTSAQASGTAPAMMTSPAPSTHLERLLRPIDVTAWVRVPRRFAPNWVQLLKFIGPEGKTYAQVKQFLTATGLPIKPDAVRAGLMNYRKEFGLVENPKKGFYVVTEKALEMIRAQEGESPATGDSEASKTQPHPLTEAAA